VPLTDQRAHDLHFSGGPVLVEKKTVGMAPGQRIGLVKSDDAGSQQIGDFVDSRTRGRGDEKPPRRRENRLPPLTAQDQRTARIVINFEAILEGMHPVRSSQGADDLVGLGIGELVPQNDRYAARADSGRLRLALVGNPFTTAGDAYYRPFQGKRAGGEWQHADFT
jgi:hypothetical protein